ncbi:MAG: PrgI family protein [Anaplasmataceae bacterium]|nr:PrgI family protein [Anaplasmataceae bacterium]
MQFQVPQFIDTEDKIVGPLTLRQFSYLFVAGVFVAILYFTVTTILWLILSLILFSAALILAFSHVEGLPLYKILKAMVRYMWRPQSYVWQPHNPNKHKADDIDQLAPKGSPLEKVVLGFFLQRTWKTLQTGSTTENETPKTKEIPKKQEEQYQIFRKLSGERQAARRIDYR